MTNGSILGTPVPPNVYGFTEVTLSDQAVLVTNNLGRKALFGELVYLDGYFGNVLDQDGIADTETGRIDITGDRTIRTEQVEATDTFTAGNALWFVSGGSVAAGTLEDSDPGSGTRLKVGIITDEEGTAGAQTAVVFRPFLQRLDSVDVEAQVETNTAGIATNVSAIGTLASLTTTEQGSLVGAVNEVDGDVGDLTSLTTTEQGSAVGAINELDGDIGDLVSLTTTEKGSVVGAINEVDLNVDNILAEPRILVIEVDSDYGTAAVAIVGLSEGDKIIGMHSICNVSETAGTIQLLDGADNAISDALQQATANEVAYAATLDVTYTTLPATGAKLIATGTDATAVRCTVVIEYIPA